MWRTLVIGLVVVTGIALALAQPKPQPQIPRQPAPTKPGTSVPSSTPGQSTELSPSITNPTLKSVKLSCASDDALAREFCATSGICTSTVASCFPYRCASTTKACAHKCTANADCSGGFACEKGKCTVPRTFCDGNSSKNSFGASRNCAPYLCDPPTGLCRAQTCTSVDDCSPGNICVGSGVGQCVPASTQK